jgi:hypothetical protein
VLRRKLKMPIKLLPCGCEIDEETGPITSCADCEKDWIVAPKGTNLLGSAECDSSISDALGLDQVRSTEYLLRTLADIADKLVDRCNYDGHGHEEIRYSIIGARNRADSLHKIHSKLVKK